VRKFLRCAREYVLAYLLIWHQMHEGTAPKSPGDVVVPVMLEKMVKFKMHIRCALDFDSTFCKLVLQQNSD